LAIWRSMEVGTHRGCAPALVERFSLIGSGCFCYFGDVPTVSGGSREECRSLVLPPDVREKLEETALLENPLLPRHGQANRKFASVSKSGACNGDEATVAFDQISHQG
jgi:hypothetical protein